MSDTEKQQPKKKLGRKKASELDVLSTQLKDEINLIDREIEEASLHNRPKHGISDKEPELELGRRLEEARRELKLTQGELADLTKQADSEGVGISRAVISMYEVGKNRPSPRELRILCEALRISPNHLIYGDEDPFDDLLERDRFGGFAQSDPEFNALLTYAFHSLYKHHKLDIMHIMMGLLRGWDKGWFENKTDMANKHFLESAEALKKLLKDREAL